MLSTIFGYISILAPAIGAVIPRSNVVIPGDANISWTQGRYSWNDSRAASYIDPQPKHHAILHISPRDTLG